MRAGLLISESGRGCGGGGGMGGLVQERPGGCRLGVPGEGAGGRRGSLARLEGACAFVGCTRNRTARCHSAPQRRRVGVQHGTGFAGHRLAAGCRHPDTQTTHPGHSRPSPPFTLPPPQPACPVLTDAVCPARLPRPHTLFNSLTSTWPPCFGSIRHRNRASFVAREWRRRLSIPTRSSPVCRFTALPLTPNLRPPFTHQIHGYCIHSLVRQLPALCNPSRQASSQYRYVDSTISLQSDWLRLRGPALLAQILPDLIRLCQPGP